jgi:TRAP transporter 4TM/12TM fusion protein
MGENKKLDFDYSVAATAANEGKPDELDEHQQEILRKADKEYDLRKNFGGWQKIVVDGVALLTTVFLLMANADLLGISNVMSRIIALGLVLFLGLMMYPFSHKGRNKKASLLELFLAIVASSSCFYLVFNYTSILERGTTVGPYELVFGCILIIGLLEAVRRTSGLALPILSICFMLYGHFGQIMPGVLNHKDISINRIVSQLYLGQDGIFGVAFGVATTYIFLFIFFGVLINHTGMGQFFNDMANSIAGDKPGGPAKVAIISSGFMGMINGSGAANVVTTGTFTIPLMKSLGYKPTFAGAVEAVASSGGQVMPPIMGAAAFVMAEYLSISYITICIAAVIPAFLYYFSLYVAVDAEAKRLKLMGQDKSQLPKFTRVMMDQGILLIPILFLIYMMSRGYTAIYAVFFSIGSLIALNIIFGILAKYGYGNTKLLTPRDYLAILINGGKGSIGIMLSCAIIGIIVGIISLTGLGLMMANVIISMSGGILFVTMLFTMIVSIVLGMGLPITPCYIIVATIAAPALVKLGVPPLAAHMFVLYFGAMSAITPPVALAAFAAAGICGAPAWSVGWQAVRLGIAGFLVPFAFVYGPELLLPSLTIPSYHSSIPTTIWVFFACMFGLFCLACGSIGYFRGNLNMVSRILLIIAAVLCIFPERISTFVGLGIALAVVAIVLFREKRGTRAA